MMSHIHLSYKQLIWPKIREKVYGFLNKKTWKYGNVEIIRSTSTITDYICLAVVVEDIPSILSIKIQATGANTHFKLLLAGQSVISNETQNNIICAAIHGMLDFLFGDIILWINRLFPFVHAIKYDVGSNNRIYMACTFIGSPSLEFLEYKWNIKVHNSRVEEDVVDVLRDKKISFGYMQDVMTCITRKGEVSIILINKIDFMQFKQKEVWFSWFMYQTQLFDDMDFIGYKIVKRTVSVSPFTFYSLYLVFSNK